MKKFYKIEFVNEEGYTEHYNFDHEFAFLHYLDCIIEGYRRKINHNFKNDNHISCTTQIKVITHNGSKEIKLNEVLELTFDEEALESRLKGIF